MKLGTSGLINAYRTGAALALAEAEIGERFLTHRLRISFTYELMGQVMNALNQLNLSMLENDFGAHPNLVVETPRSEAASVKKQLLARIGAVYLEEVTEKFSVPGLEITIE